MSVKSNTSCFAPTRILTPDILAIAFLWCVSLTIVNPFGNFPLNDDWSYGLTVKHLIEKWDFRPTGWTSMPLITNALWGSLFCVPAGFSFNALRLSTLTLSLVGILGAYVLMRNVCQSRWLACIVALTLGFNPICYAMSNTFLTDVPFTAIMILAAIFFLRTLRTESTLDLLAGTAFAVAATLSRQLGISVALAFAVVLLLKRGITTANLARAALPPALCIGVLSGFQHWLAATGRLPALYYSKNADMLGVLLNPDWFIRVVTRNIYVTLLYLGLFLSPVLLFEVATLWARQKGKAITIFIASVGAVLVLGRFLDGRTRLMPVLSFGILDKSGIGPFTLRDTFVLNNLMPTLPAGFWWVITVVSVAGAALLITTLGLGAIGFAQRVRPSKINDSEAAAIFFLLSAMIYLLPLMIMPSSTSPMEDKYFVPLIPLFAGCIASVSSQLPRIDAKISRFGVVMLLCTFGLFAICGTRDYLAWNRARWEAVDDLMKSKPAKAGDIDGGFEFNGLYLYDPEYRQSYTKSWWWVQGDTYLIAFRPLPGYRVIKEYNYHHWMPPYNGKVVVLGRL
jgi:hypothetical protein